MMNMSQGGRRLRSRALLNSFLVFELAQEGVHVLGDLRAVSQSGSDFRLETGTGIDDVRGHEGNVVGNRFLQTPAQEVLRAARPGVRRRGQRDAACSRIHACGRILKFAAGDGTPGARRDVIAAVPWRTRGSSST